MKPFSKCKRPGQQASGVQKGWLALNGRNYEDVHLTTATHQSHGVALRVSSTHGGSGSIYANAKLRVRMIEELSLPIQQQC